MYSRNYILYIHIYIYMYMYIYIMYMYVLNYFREQSLCPKGTPVLSLALGCSIGAAYFRRRYHSNSTGSSISSTRRRHRALRHVLATTSGKFNAHRKFLCSGLSKQFLTRQIMSKMANAILFLDLIYIYIYIHRRYPSRE